MNSEAQKLRVDAIRSICDEILKRYGITYSEYLEERCDGKIRFIHLVLKFKVDPGEAP